MASRFDNDGCTGFFNGWGGLDWKVCCDIHDHAFATGTSFQEFVVATYDIWQCVLERDIFAATLVGIGVIVFGLPMFFFGIKKPWVKKQ